MLYLDTALLDLTEWLCRKFQRLTGRTNVWLAMQLTNLSIVIYFVWAGLQFVSATQPIRIAIGLFCGALLYTLTQTVFRVPVEAYENEAYRRVAKGLRNPRRVRDALLRVSFLTLGIALLALAPLVFPYSKLPAAVLWLGYLLVVLTLVVLYLFACDPLPPCTGMLSALFAKQTVVSPHPVRQEEIRAVALAAPAVAAVEPIRVLVPLPQRQLVVRQHDQRLRPTEAVSDRGELHVSTM
jgi:hypothetical protein